MQEFNPANVPAHVAIIMDGNGRWANARGLPRTMGHRKGVEAVRGAVRTAAEIGIRYLTLFAFSSENWNRPENEVSDLMGLLKAFIRRDLADLHRENVRIRVIGDRSNLSGDILPLLIEAEETTIANTGITVVIAFNYGARDELARAMRRLAGEVAAGRLRPKRLPRNGYPRRSIRRAFPIPISSSGRAARSVSPTFSFGRGPTPNCCSFRTSGRISRARHSLRRSNNMPAASADSAD